MALLVVPATKCKAINLIIEYLKLLLVLAERLCLYYLIVLILIDKAKK
jgi:hypothetical protein